MKKHVRQSGAGLRGWSPQRSGLVSKDIVCVFPAIYLVVSEWSEVCNCRVTRLLYIELDLELSFIACRALNSISTLFLGQLLCL